MKSAYFAHLLIIPIIVMTFTETVIPVFRRAISDYHRYDDVDHPMPAPSYADAWDTFYKKCWIDTVQWHLEDLIRDPEIDPVAALELKRRIDRSNQERTDIVEQIDDIFRNRFSDVEPLPDATLNTESPGWAVDRLSILQLKLWHMDEQCSRKDVTDERHAGFVAKYNVLEEQHRDLCTSIDQLLTDIEQGRKWMKVYRQMKLYNDPTTNPVIYGKRKG